MKPILRASLAGFWAGCAGLCFAETTMTAESVLQKVLDGPTVPYAGEITITHWSGRAAHAEEARVYVASPDQYRYEFLNPSGEVSRVVVGTGGFEYVLLPDRGKILHGQAAHGTAAKRAPSKILALVTANYHASPPEEDEMAGRDVLTLELTPRAAGKPRERLWLDPQTGVLLALRRYGPETTDAAAVRFVHFEPNPEFEPNFFDVEKTSESIVKDHGLRDANKSLSDLAKNGRAYPESLPYGFVFTGGSQFRVQGETVTQFTYSDGLTVVSIFETALPVRPEAPADNETHFSADGLTTLSLHFPTRVVHGRGGKYFLTVMGDGNETLLNRICQGWPSSQK